ncbi:MAG TPA: twin-arginine translocase subunit TatC [Ktedonobacterales bacterium]|jgi:sec-independent protein translocase protein TatC
MAVSEEFETPNATSAQAPDQDQAPDEEYQGATMTLVEHLEELRRRILISLGAIAVGAVVGFIIWERLLGILLWPMPKMAHSLIQNGKLLATAPGEPFVVSLKIATAFGFVAALPIVLYEVWAFIAPALTRREKKYAFRFTLLGVGLFAIGIVVGFLVMRYPLEFLFNYGGNNFVLLPDADNYFSFVTFFLLAFGLVFELPLVLTFMAVVGLVSSQFLRAKRMYILFGLWLLSCFVTPGADPYSPIIIGISFTILFELSILLIRALGR